MVSHIVSSTVWSLILLLSQVRPVPLQVATVIRGDSFAFSLTPPRGWAIDTVRWAHQVNAGIYPLHEEYGRMAPMWVLVATKAIEGTETLNNLLAYGSKLSSDKDPAPKITDFPNYWRTRDDKPVRVRVYEHMNSRYVEAYIDDADFVVVIALKNSDNDRLNSLLPAFKDLAGSYIAVALDPDAHSRHH